MRYYLAILFAVGTLIVPWFASNYPAALGQIVSGVERVGDQLASVILAHNPKTISQIQARYDDARPRLFRAAPKKVRILVVPGHEPEYGGAKFRTLREREMTVELAEHLRRYLAESDRYEVIVTRDTRSWHATFAEYFEEHAEAIVAWRQAHKEEIINLTRLGEFKPITPAVFHNTAPADVAMRLYGIDRWSNENDIDIVIHAHFNDYPRADHSRPGKYSGFAIYVPEKQYFNSTTTIALAKSVFKSLEKYNAVSDLPGEKSGIVEDQDLIAVGSYNSLNAASMLIEYGYIYEPQFIDEEIRSRSIKDLAYQTYVGLDDFFAGENNQRSGSFGTSILPHSWSAAEEKDLKPEDAFALQTALLLDGLYPPQNKSKNECPRSGKIGACTKAAVQAFQEKYGITDEKGRVGPKTLEELNKAYGAGTSTPIL